MPSFVSFCRAVARAFALAGAVVFLSHCRQPTPPATTAAAPTAALLRHVEGGSGQYYMGREIAEVMGHEGADWLERPEREREEHTDQLLTELPLRPDLVVADLGAGTGYFTFRLARRVPQGQVLAVDIQPEMLTEIERRKAALGLTNVRAVRGTEQDPQLPAGAVDLVLLVDAYHEFAYPQQMAAGIRRGLKPGGVVALVEFRAEDPAVLIKPAHKMTVAQARREWEAAGFRFLEARQTLPQQHVLLFVKPAVD